MHLRTSTNTQKEPLVRLHQNTHFLECRAYHLESHEVPACTYENSFNVLYATDIRTRPFCSLAPLGIVFHAPRELLRAFEHLQFKAFIEGRISVTALIVVLKRLHAREGLTEYHKLDNLYHLFCERHVYVPWYIVHNLLYEGSHLRNIP